MFNSDIRVQIAAIMTRAAYFHLADPTIEKDLAQSVIDGHAKYVGPLTSSEQAAMRLIMIRQTLPFAQRLLIERADNVLVVEANNAARFVGAGYSSPIYRKVAIALKVCAKASDREEYFGVVEVSKQMVTIAMLPWLWGFTNWQWKFGERPPRSAMRDYFMLMTGAEEIQQAAMAMSQTPVDKNAVRATA